MPTRRSPWSARFAEPVDERVKRFTASVNFDRRLAKYDIQGSLAHARMLAVRGVLTRRDFAAIRRGLSIIAREIETGRFRWSVEAEDVHLNIERRLTALVGDAGKRLHTGRSRNDQVATDVRLWLRAEIDEIRALIGALQQALLDQAEQHAALVMPGFTHLQVAQPVTFGHHLLAYVEMLERDRERLADARRRLSFFGDVDTIATIGTPDRCIDTLRKKVAQGITYFVCLFTDGGQPETVRLFGERVLPAFR